MKPTILVTLSLATILYSYGNSPNTDELARGIRDGGRDFLKLTCVFQRETNIALEDQLVLGEEWKTRNGLPFLIRYWKGSPEFLIIANSNFVLPGAVRSGTKIADVTNHYSSGRLNGDLSKKNFVYVTLDNKYYFYLGERLEGDSKTNRVLRVTKIYINVER